VTCPPINGVTARFVGGPLRDLDGERGEPDADTGFVELGNNELGLAFPANVILRRE
jgi:hypothetical protein